MCPADITKESFEARLRVDEQGFRPIRLTEQLRIRAGSEYVSYIYDILNQRAPIAKQFADYDFKLFRDFRTMYRCMQELEQTVGLCRLCGGYAWEWDKSTYNIQIENVNVKWNRQTSGWLRNPAAAEEMGSIYTLLGLDLNYAVVVIGPDLYYDPRRGCMKVDLSHFYDNNVKRNTREEDILRYILNTYAVLMTRGIIGTYIYACDENLSSYLQQYIPLA